MPGAAAVLHANDDTSRRGIDAFASVVTTAPVECEGRMLPGGSDGTVIDVSPVAGNYAVEFLRPFHCVAFVTDAQIAPA